MRKIALHAFCSFSPLSQRLVSRNVEINKQFRNQFITCAKRFYGAEPDKLPKNFIDYLKCRFEEYETVPYTKRTRCISLPIALEKEQGEKQFEQFIQSSEGERLPPTHPDSARVTQILNNILDALQRERNKMRSVSDFTVLRRVWLHIIRRSPPSMSHLDGLNWEVLIVSFPEMTGVCYSGGKIVLSKKLIEHFASDGEIAIFIAHEVAHTVARHIAEMITKTAWVTTIHMVLQTFTTFDFRKHVWPLALRLPFNRRFEIEADYIGLLLMAAAGYDPRVAPKVCNELGNLDGSNNGSMLTGFIKTHPSGRTRAKALTRPKIMEEALILYNDARARCVVE